MAAPDTELSWRVRVVDESAWPGAAIESLEQLTATDATARSVTTRRRIGVKVGLRSPHNLSLPLSRCPVLRLTPRSPRAHTGRVALVRSLRPESFRKWPDRRCHRSRS